MQIQLSEFEVRLREERERIGLSLADLGALGGVNRVTQARYETGANFPTIQYLAGISSSVDMHFLLTGTRNSDDVVLKDYEALTKAIELVDGLTKVHNFIPSAEFRGRAVARLYQRIQLLGSKKVKPTLEELLYAGSQQD